MTNIFVTVANVGQVDDVEAVIRRQLADTVDVLSVADQARAAQSALGEIRRSTTMGAALALVAAALVVLFTTALVVRSRTQEIGVLKAVGASDGDVAWQFAAETAALTLVAGAVALVFFPLLGPAVSTLLLPGGAVQVAYQLSVRAALIVLGVSVVLGLVGSLYPVWRAVRLQPAEALRFE